jgi:hypothetical protein
MYFEIFKVGTHTSANGVTKDYTIDHLHQIVQNHSDPTPIVVGHPKDNSPAFGWIKNLFIKGESLFAEASDLVPEFLDLIKQKIYKNRSVSLKQNEDGTLSLNHVGFLGGVLPAVKGLAELNLNADNTDEISFDVSDLSAEFTEIVKLSDHNVTDDAVVNNNAKKPIKKVKTSSDFAEVISGLRNDIKNIKSEFMEAIQTVQGSVDTNNIQARIDELNLKLDSAFFQKNVIGKLQVDNLTPAIKSKLLNLLNYFESLDFSETDQLKIVSEFQELADLIVPFQTEEVIRKSDEDAQLISNNAFSEMNVDKESLVLFNEASQLAKLKEITFNEALNILINKDNAA